MTTHEHLCLRRSEALRADSAECFECFTAGIPYDVIDIVH